jgi:hypothetical protein
MFNKNQNIVICFPSGSGGHLLGTLCSMLLGGPGVLPGKDGSMHNVSAITHGVHHAYIELPQDEVIQSKMPDCNITIGHFTNVKLLKEVGKKVIYITFVPEDIDEIARRANKKTSVNLKDEKTYKILAGNGWPSYEEYCAGAPISTGELNHEGKWEVKKIHYSHCVYNLPEDKSNTLEIKFDEINNSNCLVDKLANFMCVEQYDKNKVMNTLHTYRSCQ